MKWHTLADIVVLFVLVVSCTSVATPIPTVTPLPTTIALPTVITLPTATSAPTLTPLPSNTPTPTLPPIAATAWASDASGKVNPQTMYPLVGAVDYKHRKTIDLVYGNVFLAVVTDQDLTKVSADEQKNLRSKLAASLNQNQGTQKLLSEVSIKLTQSNAGGTKFIIVIEGNKPIQAIVQQTNMQRYSIGQSGILTIPDTRYRLLPPLEIKGKNIVRADTGEVIRFKGFDMMSSVTDIVPETPNRVNEKLRTPQYVKIAKDMTANILRVSYNTAYVRDRIEDFKMIAELAERYGMYVIFTASSKSGKHADALYPDDEIISREVELARLLRTYDNVIMDIYNEPHDVDANTMRLAVTKAVDRIEHEGGHRGLMIVPGIDWARKMDYLPDATDILNNPRVFCRLNLSTSVNDPKYQNAETYDRLFKEFISQFDAAMQINKPFLIGEFNNVPDHLSGSDIERKWQTDALEYINRNKLSYTQFQLNYYGKQAVLEGSNINNYKLRQKGEIVNNDLQANPPYQFDK